MAKYLINSDDIEIEEVSGTENLKFNLANGNSVEQMIGDLSDLDTTDKSNVVNAINEVNTNLTNLNTYSTTEINTGKVWVDGKPIYRQVIIGTTVANDYQVIKTITNLETLINLYGNSGSEYKGNPNWQNLGVSPTQFRQFGLRNTQLICVQNTLEALPYTLIIEYTKTTD